MPNPEDVNPQKFRVEHILYNDGDFSIAWGEWNGERMCLGMRWNGSGEDVGYPKLFNNPIWFVLPKSLSFQLLKSVLGSKAFRNRSILSVLEQLTI